MDDTTAPATNAALSVGWTARTAEIAAIPLLTGVAWLNRFVQDDAYISYRYARNLAEGAGLVFNPGQPPVEGYTNFLWTLLLSAGMRWGVDPVTLSYLLGIACFAVMLVAVSRATTRLTGSRWLGVLAMLLVGLNYSVASYATGGLETSLQTMLFALAGWIAVCRPGQRSASLMGLVTALALLTRLDSAVVVGPLAAPVAWRVRRSPIAIALLVTPLAVLVGGWLLWKVGYYGEILPNTLAAKTGDLAKNAARGLRYVWAFGRAYWLWPFVLLAVAQVGWLAIRTDLQRTKDVLGRAALWGLVVLWCGYVVAVGGDFMEFRFLVPITPFVLVGLVWAASQVHHLAPIGLVVVLIAASAFHSRSTVIAEGIETVPQLAAHLSQPSEDWIDVGRALGRVFDDSTVVIATTAAGAIPYESRLPTIDMLGLNDRWVARNGVPAANQTGHTRVASMRYLVDSRVNLIVGHPWLRPRADTSKTRYGAEDLRDLGRGDFLSAADAAVLPAEAAFFEIPVNDQYLVVVLYVTPHPAVDSAIVAQDWDVYPLR